ncbi:MAG: MotA/TolQ/ExbB proton channel family protein [Christensenellaceae bacterium]|nr:MotA/TolQ/ExbB proton channel family protein [Christensenellaceae bacterium]
MPEVIQGLMATLAADAASSLVYLAIAAVFAIAVVRCVAPVLQSGRLLRRAARRIIKGDKAKQSWQEQEFLGKGALYAHWCEYLNNLFFADGAFHNPSDVEDFINEDTAILGPGHSQFAEAAPGLMTSLGFLGTLIGISAGLRGFSMDNAEQVMRAIRQLVPGMQYAFMTSIVGVICAISCTILVRLTENRTQQALGAFYAAMRQHAGVVSVEPMTQIAIYQQEQTALIQGLVRDLSGALAERMAEQLGTAVGRAVGGMQRSLDDFMVNSSREQLRGLDVMVQRFIHELNRAVNGQFELLAGTLEATAQNQRALNDVVHQAIVDLNRVAQGIAATAQLTGNMLSRMEAYTAKLDQNAQLAEEAYQRVAGNVERLDVLARPHNGYLQSVGKLQGEISKSIDRFESTGQRLVETFGEHSKQASASMREASGALKQSGELLAANHKALTGGVAKDIDRTYNSFFKSTNEAVDHLTWLIEDVKNSVARLPDTLDAAANLYGQQADRLTDALRRTQAALDDAVDRLAQAAYTNR